MSVPSKLPVQLFRNGPKGRGKKISKWGVKDHKQSEIGSEHGCQSIILETETLKLKRKINIYCSIGLMLRIFTRIHGCNL